MTGMAAATIIITIITTDMVARGLPGFVEPYGLMRDRWNAASWTFVTTMRAKDHDGSGALEPIDYLRARSAASASWAARAPLSCAPCAVEKS